MIRVAARRALLGMTAAAAMLAPVAGCGFDRFVPETLPTAAGLTLFDLEMIQNNTALTDDERRDMIREAIGAPETDEGDRLVEFLLTFNVP